ncbi:hypothetical protein [Actinospica robiniae]|uniref:hypothetical protein n=1 Tax=Actinospica robiniae TaxID=304901 RepID=UPI0004206C70|nr:hypothetical protein [Actinospica robiniae]
MSMISRVAGALQRDVPARILGMGLLVATLYPARLGEQFGTRWVLVGAALVAGCWAAPPLRERPVMAGHKLWSRVSRYRNTLLPCVGVLLAATSTPPTWLMVVDLVLVLMYLSVLDLHSEAPGTPPGLGSHAVAAWIAAGTVLGAALTPVSGGWWGRIVAAGAVLAISATVYAVLRLSKPASYHQPTSGEARRP